MYSAKNNVYKATKRWDTKILNINGVIHILNKIIDISNIDLGFSPRKYDKRTILCVLVVKELFNLSLRSMEVFSEYIFNKKIDHSTTGKEISPKTSLKL